MDWYKTGDAGSDQAEREDKINAGKGKPFRFWLKPGNSTEFTILDTEFFFYKEHNLYLNNNWMNWETCLTDIPDADDCPLCENSDLAFVSSYSYIAMLTIIDHSQYTTKRGNLIENSKKLLPLKSLARNKMLKQKKRRDGNLVGCRYEASRYTPKENSTGSDFEFVKQVSLEELHQFAPQGADPVEWVKPFDYAKLFQPKSARELRQLIGAPAPVGSEESFNTSVGQEPKKVAELL
jgi:hypothetical protein